MSLSPEAVRALCTVKTTPYMEHVWTKRTIAKAEAVQMTLQQYLQKHQAETLHVKQHAFIGLTGLEALYGGAAGAGKALHIGTPVATPSGWSTMGDLKPGDYVFDEHGSPVCVMAATDVFYESTFRLTFDDGAELIAGARHRWLTRTDAERMAAQRRTPEFRTKRRAGRPSRALHDTLHSRTLSEINSLRALTQPTLQPSIGTVRETYEIAQSVTVRNGSRTNHSITNCEPLQLPQLVLPIDPYLLGAWLGDGATSSGTICVPEAAMVEQLTAVGAVLTAHATGISYGVKGLAAKLRSLGVLGHKHIPMQYLRASASQRLALLQGLMDTDGTADKLGRCEYCTVSPELADDFEELLVSLGIKCQPLQRLSYLYGVRKQDRYRFHFTSSLPVFRLQRKLTRQRAAEPRDTTTQRYITACERTADVPLRCIEVDNPSGLFLAGRSMIPTHNSDVLLMLALQYVDVPNYAALLLRLTMPELRESLITRSQEWLSDTDAKYNINDHVWKFPSGARLHFGHMRRDEDRFRYQSAEFQCICFDELTQFSEIQYTYMFSRLRRLEGVPVPIRMRAATNPGGRGHVWVKDRFIEKKPPWPKLKRDRIFLQAKFTDNPALDLVQYKAALAMLDESTRLQYEEGDWDARPPGDWMIPDPRMVDESVRACMAALAAGEIPDPPNGELHTATDWGEITQSYVIWPLEQGGIYIPPSEVYAESLGIEDEIAPAIYQSVAKFGFRYKTAHFDNSKPQDMRTFMASVYKTHPETVPSSPVNKKNGTDLHPHGVAFGKYKRETILYMRLLFARTANGEKTRRILIHPDNVQLVRQLKGWRRKGPESEEAIKEDDHGPDALVAGIAQTAVNNRRYVEEVFKRARKEKT